MATVLLSPAERKMLESMAEVIVAQVPVLLLNPYMHINKYGEMCKSIIRKGKRSQVEQPITVELFDADSKQLVRVSLANETQPRRICVLLCAELMLTRQQIRTVLDAL